MTIIEQAEHALDWICATVSVVVFVAWGVAVMWSSVRRVRKIRGRGC